MEPFISAMKPLFVIRNPFLVLLVLVVGACAPAGAARGPADGPLAQRSTCELFSAAGGATGVAAAAAQWWLLDLERDCVHGISAERAYRELLAGREPARTVTVAIIDSGIDIEHEDLAGNIWVNEGEVPRTGRDDDGNGYVDDVSGWNFIGGPDGRHVHHDTYEVTRLYASLRGRYASARPDTLAAAQREEYERFLAVQADFEARRAETAQMLEQARAIEAAIPRFAAILSAHLGVDAPTAEQIAGIRTTRPEVRQAQQVMLQLIALGLTPEVIARQRESLEGRLQYGLDPSFDPRPIVGDDYSDPRERYYGNPDVRGPGADHGTHVAGIVAARRGNDLGMDGIAPAVRIMPIRAVPDGDERDKDIANAIRYAVDNGAQIINMSFGKGYSPRKQMVDEAVRYADSRGVLMVHAAGNDAADLGGEPSFPTRFYDGGGEARHWIEVGASAWWGADSLAAPFSNYGRDQVHVFAPGVDIRSTVPDNAYESNSGTSMAAPVVSGLAAMLMAYYPELDAGEVKRIILESATPYAAQQVNLPGGQGRRIAFGELSATGGVVNAYAAIQMAERLSARSRN